MKKLFMITTGIFFLFSSCKNPSTESDTDKATEEVSTSVESESPPNIMMVKVKIKDYDKFKTMYDAKDSLRDAYGISKFILSKQMDDPGIVYITEIFEDLQKAKDFSTSEGVKKAAEEGGSVGQAEFSFITMLRLEDTPPELKDRVMIKHKVKDFDTWLKVFDAEGKETRAKFGLLDRALGRGADDPNMVYIVFTISDAEKAKARQNSPELKKLMEDGGVIDQPSSIMYTVQQSYQ